jgi:hypothetical protein
VAGVGGVGGHKRAESGLTKEARRVRRGQRARRARRARRADVFIGRIASTVIRIFSPNAFLNILASTSKLVGELRGSGM